MVDKLLKYRMQAMFFHIFITFPPVGFIFNNFSTIQNLWKTVEK